MLAVAVFTLDNLLPGTKFRSMGGALVLAVAAFTAAGTNRWRTSQSVQPVSAIFTLGICSRAMVCARWGGARGGGGEWGDVV